MTSVVVALFASLSYFATLVGGWMRLCNPLKKPSYQQHCAAVLLPKALSSTGIAQLSFPLASVSVCRALDDLRRLPIECPSLASMPDHPSPRR